MKISVADEELKKVLHGIYDEREAANIAKVFWEDLFGYRGGVDRVLHTREIVVFRDALVKLKKRMPIQYVTEVSFFYNLKLKVNKHVLIPRPETEELVYLALSEGVGERILDIGTGSGCIPIALKSRRPEKIVSAVDISDEALDLARINAEKCEVSVNFIGLDFLNEAEWSRLGTYNTIISNPPYIDRSEQGKMSASTIEHEPEIALYPESEDALIFYRKIALFAQSHLSDGGNIYLECNEFNSGEVVKIFQEQTYEQVRIENDLQGKPRFLLASKSNHQ